MHILSSVLFAASTARAAGIIIALIAVAGFVVYGLFNIRAGREEVGSEVELAANLKPYADDDELETSKLDRALTMGLAGLVICGVGVPAYWLAEPGRQTGSVIEYERVFASRGAGTYEGACQSCHAAAGVGGVAPFTILDDEGEFVASVQWRAPALNNVLLRYSREEVTYILNYGRSFSPMPAWGGPGGGAFTEQEVKNVIDYLATIQLTPEESQAAVENELRATLGLTEFDSIDYDDLATGEALFNLGRDSGFAGGAYACGRCHTRGWSINDDPSTVAVQAGKTVEGQLREYIDYPDGAGSFGPPINNGVIPRQFSSVDALADFLYDGAKLGQTYGNAGLSGDGMMPGFGENPNTTTPDDGMLSEKMVRAIAEYVASLNSDNEAA